MRQRYLLLSIILFGNFLSGPSQADFTLHVSPTIRSATLGQSAVFDVSVGGIFGFSDPVTLSVSGNPTGTVLSFTPNPLSPGGIGRLTITHTEAAVAGEFPLHIVAVAPTSTHTVDVSLNLVDGLASQQDFILDILPPVASVCAPSDAVFNVRIASTVGFDDPVTLSAGGNPPGTTIGFSQNPVTPPGSSLLTIGGTGMAVAGRRHIEVVAVAPTSTQFATSTWDLFDTVPSIPMLLAPANHSAGAPTLPSFSWSETPNADSYQIELSDAPSFDNVIYSTVTAGTTHRPGLAFPPRTVHY